MSKIKENITTSNVRSHIKKAFELINVYLPEQYVAKVHHKLPKDSKIPSSTIRNVRNQTGGEKFLKNHLNIIKALVEVAKDNKLAQEELEKAIT